MSVENHKALVRRYINEAWNAGQPAAPFFAPHYKRYVTATAAPLTGAEQQQRIRGFQSAFPDLHFTIDDLLAEGDRIVFRVTMRGTHLGVFRNIAPTGKPVTITVLDIVRIEEGLFTEHWGGPDLFDLLQQLDAVLSISTHEKDAA